MTELTQGIFSTAKNIYKNNKGSILRTIVYTIGHFAIAIIVLMSIADVSFAVVNSSCLDGKFEAVLISFDSFVCCSVCCSERRAREK